MEVDTMRMKKDERQRQLIEKIEHTPFITDEELAAHFDVSVQTIRLDRLELAIPELRQRTMPVATNRRNETAKTRPTDVVVVEIANMELDGHAIAIMHVQREQVFSRNKIAREHHLLAQASPFGVAL